MQGTQTVTMAALELTLTISACLGCKVCPQGKLAAAYQNRQFARRLTFADFVTALSKLPKDVEIHFSGFSEPFLHPGAPAMIHEACRQGFGVQLYTTLMGLTENGAAVLRDCRFNAVRLHLPDQKHLRINADIWLSQFELFKTTGHKYTAMAMSNVEEPIATALEKAGVEIELPDMLSRGGALWKPRHLTGPIRCTANRWHNNVMLPDGSVVVCCMDWGLSMPLGNLLTDSYAQISEKAEAYARNTNPPDDSICRDCEWASNAN